MTTSSASSSWRSSAYSQVFAVEPNRINVKSRLESAPHIRIDGKTKLATVRFTPKHSRLHLTALRFRFLCSGVSRNIPLSAEVEAGLLYNDDHRAQGHIIHRSGYFCFKVARAVIMQNFWLDEVFA